MRPSTAHPAAGPASAQTRKKLSANCKKKITSPACWPSGGALLAFGKSTTDGGSTDIRWPQQPLEACWPLVRAQLTAAALIYGGHSNRPIASRDGWSICGPAVARATPRRGAPLVHLHRHDGGLLCRSAGERGPAACTPSQSDDDREIADRAKAAPRDGTAKALEPYRPIGLRAGGVPALVMQAQQRRGDAFTCVQNSSGLSQITCAESNVMYNTGGRRRRQERAREPCKNREGGGGSRTTEMLPCTIAVNKYYVGRDRTGMRSRRGREQDEASVRPGREARESE